VSTEIASEGVSGFLDEIVRLLTLELRDRRDTQVQAILALASAGFEPKRIADLLNTTPNTVSVALSRAKHSERSGTHSPKIEPKKDEV
jgi:DNA-directed RNA polymerase specialized sigma24 family protein